MFKLVGTPKRVAFAKLVFDGHQDFDTEEVREMEASFADTGGEPLHYPLVAKQEGKTTFRVVVGRTRLKALKRAGKKEVLVQLVAGDEEELQTAAIIENLRRRQVDQKDLLKALDNVRQRIIAQAGDNCATGQNKPKRGRPSEGKGESRKVVAKLTGQTPKAIEHQEARARDAGKKESEPDEATAADEPRRPPVGFETLGREIPPDVLDRIEKEQEMVDEMSELLTKLAGLLTVYEKQILPEGRPEKEHRQTKFRDPLERLAYAIRKNRPASVCPYCKRVEKPQEDCSFCGHTGYVAEFKIDKSACVPPEYFVEDDNAILQVGGKNYYLQPYLDGILEPYVHGQSR